MEEPFVFVHITDIHLQRREESNTFVNYRHFVKHILPLIQPNMVINTGDITTSLHEDKSKLMEEDEWFLYINRYRIRNRYSSVLKETGWFSIEKWLDIRGNHDAFVHYKGEEPYKHHTVYGSSGLSSIYTQLLKTGSGWLRFIGIDANGPTFRHFNGFLTKTMMNDLESIMSNNREPMILFCHYPLFTIDTRVVSDSGKSILDLIRLYKPLYYICGHMHSALHGMIRRVYDTIEAEQFDFKAGRQFRIYSYYHNHLSFVTYNIDIDENPILIVHSPVDSRYDIRVEEEANDVIFFSIYNALKPSIQLYLDNEEISFSSDIRITSFPRKTDVFYKIKSISGLHSFHCIITNEESRKRTILHRSFFIHSSSPILVSPSPSSSIGWALPKTHVQLERFFTEYSSIDTCFNLDYSTSRKVELLMRVDWSRVMLYLNPLILFFMLLFFFYSRRIALSILSNQSGKHFPALLDFSKPWFFVTDRKMKYSLFLDYFHSYPSFFQILLSRLLLFLSDSLVYYGILTSILCRNLLPRIYIDDSSNICSFSLFGFHNWSKKEHYAYMDTYVFGASFYYAIVILFTIYMLLFASPSITRTVPYPFVQFFLWAIDAGIIMKMYDYLVNGLRRKNVMKLIAFLLQLNDSVSMYIFFALMLREKMLSFVYSPKDSQKKHVRGSEPLSNPFDWLYYCFPISVQK